MDEDDRPLFHEEHRLFRRQVRAFLAKEIVPHHPQWERDGIVPRDLWRKAGRAGLLCPTVSEEDGGPGGDALHSAVVIEELARIAASGPGFWIHSEMVAPYVSNFGNSQQKARWLPKLVSGEAIGAVAMTEPDAGSDLRGMKTRAVRRDGGWLLKGQKVFISNGQLADVVVVAAKTAQSTESNSISLFLVDAASPGFHRGRNLEKIGAHAQDTSELFFEDVLVSHDALLGEEGAGFRQLMKGLARERLSIAISCQAKAQFAFDQTVGYAQTRRLFGGKLIDLQNTRFRLADVKTELVVGRSFVDDMLRRYLEGHLDGNTAAIAKLWTTEMLGRVVDTCLQLHGGWGYMTEYPIARAYIDARVERIAGGASEVMREIIGKTLP
ncbi:acyl-CoA dehydrogenase [Bradyrhizobium sp. LTSPM299]|uniref:acyl-CoA dehydrogenase family protein n=1 Tax=Bradyrhizobium sp. LTSPM299 TaxID=1619233 RepID=UPI0005C8DBC1|nr:acyl-CoA dehydrogenase family protein [Bradyrhizobium sp. LTSPM299]KJC60336.1 acyl-CoA dehydrogenase [Bradyrhizobium sp. LTSPM299]